MKHCTYITIHEPSGLYYIGKGMTDKVKAGLYKGSGTKLKQAFNTYPKSQWKTSVLWEFETAAEAFSDEAGLLSIDLKNDPLCLNMCFEGKGGYANRTFEEISTASRKGKATMGVEGRKALRQKQLQSMSAEARKEQARKALETMGAEGRSERTRKAMSRLTSEQHKIKLQNQLATMGKIGSPASKSCTIDGITIYPSRSALRRELGCGKNGSRSPSFRYIVNDNNKETQ